jgi:hypothetical protein
MSHLYNSALINTALLAPLVPAHLAGQENPFALTGGSVKSAYIVYDAKWKPVQGVPATTLSFEMGVTPDRMVIKTATLVQVEAKKDTMTTLVVSAGDSQFTYNRLGSERGGGEVSRILRPHLAREYAGLDAAGKARFKENLKLANQLSLSGASEAIEELHTLVGEKKGSETIGGHTCDVYQTKKATVCVLRGAPGVYLRWTDEERGSNVVAKKISLNQSVPPPTVFLPKGVRWKKTGYDTDEAFYTELWGQKKQSDPEAVPPATLAKFAVSYLASPGAAKELRESQGGFPQETGEHEEPSDSAGT